MQQKQRKKVKTNPAKNGCFCRPAISSLKWGACCSSFLGSSSIWGACCFSFGDSSSIWGASTSWLQKWPLSRLLGTPSEKTTPEILINQTRIFCKKKRLKKFAQCADSAEYQLNNPLLRLPRVSSLSGVACSSSSASHAKNNFRSEATPACLISPAWLISPACLISPAWLISPAFF